MIRGRIKVDYLAETLDGPLARFVAGAAGVAMLRDAFDQLAGGEPVVAIEDMELIGLSPIEFRQGVRGGLHSGVAGRLVFDGDRAQWEDGARLRAPLAR